MTSSPSETVLLVRPMHVEAADQSNIIRELLMRRCLDYAQAQLLLRISSFSLEP